MKENAIPIAPRLSFTRPATPAELVQYHKWLADILGSEDSLVDGWGRHIKLTLDDKSNPPILIASSAGPDGKWGTKDDMILKLDVKTGQIIEQAGFGDKK